MSQDLISKRQNIASKMVVEATALVDSLTRLLALQAERAQLSQDFQDADFTSNDLKHLTAAMVGSVFDFVVPSLNTNYLDAANAGRNKQLLLQVRK